MFEEVSCCLQCVRLRVSERPMPALGVMNGHKDSLLGRVESRFSCERWQKGQLMF